MVSIFRKNDVVNFALLLPYAVLLRIFTILHPEAYQISQFDSIIAKWFFSTVDQPLVQAILGILLVYSQAVLINVMSNNHRLHRLPSSLSGMCYILIVSCIPGIYSLSPALIGATFLLFAIFNVFRTYKMSMAASSIFNAALASSAAALIYPPYLLAVLAIFIGLAMMRNFNTIERFQFVSGYLVLIWIIGSFLYYIGALSWASLDRFSGSSFISQFSLENHMLLWTLGTAGFLVMLSLANYYNFMKKKGIDIRKKIDFFYWLMFCSFLALFVFQDLGFDHFFFMAISASLFLSMAILLVRNVFLIDLLHLLLIGFAFYFQF